MKIVFLSNYMNHHQLYLCNEWNELTKNNFYFIATMDTPEFRLKVGYKDYNSQINYVIKSYSSYPTDNVKKLINMADIVIVGGISNPIRNNYLSERNRLNKIIFAYEERFFKGEFKHFLKNMLKFIIQKKYYIQFKKNTSYNIMAASAYMKKDCKKLKIKKHVFAWGYFPFFSENDFDKPCNFCKNILWVGRFIPYKHPEKMLLVARLLKKHNYNAKITMIGDGPLFIKLKKKVLREKLENKLLLLGSKDNAEVIDYYRQSDIFVCTSDADEGWGAVVNEAMAAKCAVVADIKIGSVPFLIQSGINGLTYAKDKEMILAIEKLLLNEKLLMDIQNAAYETIVKKWNYKYAASKSYELFRSLLVKADFTDDANSIIEPCTLLNK